ncbi:MAG: TldD/PmbA family protein [Bacteroidetes bacterium]|nr:TldD/PmbA family protein [Bacteroidota bacterium]
MSTPALLALAEELVAFGRKNGASQAEVLVRQGTEFSVDVREGEIEKLTEADSNGLTLRVFVDGKMARASSSDLSGETLHRLMANAIDRARLSSADPLAGLPEKNPLAIDVAALKIYDPALLDMPPEKKIAAARETEAICLADKRIKKSFGAGYRTNVGATLLANSNGFSGSYTRTSCSCYVYLQAGEGSNLFDEGWGDESPFLGRLETPEEIARKALHRVTRLIGGRKVETQNVPVVLEPPMTGSLLSFLFNCVNGNSIYLKQSFLAGKVGEQVGNELVTIIDDGTLPEGIGTKPFDAEGVPTQKTVVMEKGILRSYLMDTYAARKLGMKSTGNASGANNLYLAAGTSTPDEIIKSVSKGLLLTGTIGFGLVPTTGDISRGAFGLWIENGEIAFPVSEITISGNLGQILRGIQMVGNDLKFKDSITGPTMKIAEMTVGGK